MSNWNSNGNHQIFWLLAPWLVIGALIVVAGQALVGRRRLLVSLPGPPPGKWLTGHFRSITGVGGIAFQERVISAYGPTIKLNGAFNEEFIFTVDPTIMHAVLVKERTKFERAKGGTLIIRSIFGGGLLGLTGPEHRAHRKLLNPVFTVKFLRELVYKTTPIFMDIAKQTTLGIKKQLDPIKGTSKEIDVFPWATFAALELIGEAGLGYSFNSFTGERNEYNNAIKIVTRFFTTMAPFFKVLPYVYHLGTPTLRHWIMEHIPSTTIQRLRHAVRVQNEQAEEVLCNRQALISSGVDLSSEAGRGRDIMTLLVKANEAEGSESHIDRRGMVGHMNVLVFAGHETTSTAVSRVLDVLSARPHVQSKLRDELRQYFDANPDDTCHDGLFELPYLDGVVRETLRLHSPTPFLSRDCEEDTILPLKYPVDTPSGKITSIPIKKGTRVLMGVAVSDRDERVWGEHSHEFLPERWIGSKLDEVTQPGSHSPGIYAPMMAFGAGPRACIGFKFAVMEIKVMTAELIKNFKFEPAREDCAWEATGIQFPYSKGDLSNPSRLPTLKLLVTEL